MHSCQRPRPFHPLPRNASSSWAWTRWLPGAILAGTTVLLSACEDPAGLGPTDEPDLARQVGNVFHGYQAPTLALDRQDGTVEVCAAWSDEALFQEEHPELFSFAFSIRSHDDPSGDAWAELESVRGDEAGAAACLRIHQEQVEMATAGLDENEAWLQVEGMARAGKGRTTTVHHTEHAHLLVSDLQEGESPGGDDGEGAGGTASADLGPEGGELSLEDPDGELRARLLVPAGALEEEVTLSIALESDPEVIGAVAVPGTAVFLSPSGISFAESVSLTLRFDPVELPDGVDPEELAIHRMGGDGTATPLPGTVDLETGAVTAELMGFSLYFVAQPSSQIAMATWVGGSTPDPTDWHDPENWSPTNLAPWEDGYALIPAGVEHYPRVTSTLAEIRYLRIAEGASLELAGAGLRVTGELIVEGSLTSDGNSLVMMDGEGTQPLRGQLPNLWVSHQATALSGDLVVDGDVQIAGTRASLEVGEHRLEIHGDLRVTGGSAESRLFMDHAFGRTVVHGDARFASAWDGEAPLRNGVLELRGNLVQAAYPEAFRASSPHRTRFAGEGIQTVHFADPESSGPWILEMGAAEELMLLSDLRTQFLSWSDEGVGSRIGGGASLYVRTSANIRGPISVDQLRLGGAITWNGTPYLVSTTVFSGDGPEVVQPQVVPAIPYQDVVVLGEGAMLDDDFVTVQGEFRIRDGSFRPGPGRLLTVRGNLVTEGEGGLIMVDDDRLVVHGGVHYGGGFREPGLDSGRLWIGGDVTGNYGGREAHTTILFGSGTQELQNTNPIASLAITNTGEEGVRVHQDEFPIQLLNLAGNSRILEGRHITVLHANYWNGSRTHFEWDAFFRCTTAWREGEEVVTSDGLGVGCKDLPRDSILDDPVGPPLEYFAVPSPLTVEILAPSQGTSVREGELVSFSATARMDGEPVAASYTWTSGLDGFLSTEQSFSTEDLSAGVHSITVEAETADGLPGLAFILVTVQAPEVGMPGTGVTVGNGHSCALDEEGRAWCWGRNGSGQLGDGTTEDRSTPTPVAGNLRFSQIVAGYSHTCGLALDGSAHCWGRAEAVSGLSGGLYATPFDVASGTAFQHLGAGGFHSCGVTTDGTAMCWGRGSEGQLGLGTEVTRSTPQPVAHGPEGPLVFQTITAGNFHTCGVLASGQAWCWGSNSVGEVGAGSEDPNLLEPTPVAGTEPYSFIIAGGYHTCALTPDGGAQCWGFNEDGQLGLGDGGPTSVSVPTSVTGGRSFRSMSGGQRHTCGISTAGEAYCWGRRSSKLGTDLLETDGLQPSLVQGGLLWQEVVAGGRHSCGLTSEGRLRCWGWNSDGQLGTADDISSSGTPYPVSSPGG
jgi:alpha-tubulin suppressor-like RCC1 family protein